jgi:hypothetical protein
MPHSSNEALNSYFVRGRKQVGGWLGRIDAEIFRILLNYQVSCNLGGSVAEIGVHHGKCFIGLCLSMQEGERAYCIDVFEDQHLNIDSSGKGNRLILERNLRHFNVDITRLIIRAASSFDIQASDIVDEAGPIRFFSIDGGHWAAIVKHDLNLAEASLADHGIVALDDFLRSEWPDVSAGFFSWASEHKGSIVPFCIGFNKLYLCHEQWREQFQSIIVNDQFTSNCIIKRTKFQNVELPVFSEFVPPESGLRTQCRVLLRLFCPDMYVHLRRIYRATLKHSGFPPG